MTSAKTAEGSASYNVVVVPKTETITAIGKLTVDTSGLTNDDASKKKDISDKITALLISELKKKGLYQPDNADAMEMTVTIRNMKRQVNERAVYAIVNVLNTKGEAVFSFAAVETSLGLRTIDYVEETFSESAVEEIAAPMDSTN